MSHTGRSVRCIVALIIACATGHAVGQPAYPTKVVRVVVPFPPGGSNDIVARFISRELTESMGQQFIVENRGGASGVIGAEAVSKSTPDGYTLMVHSTSHLSNAFSYKKLPYDTVKSFDPVALLAAQPSVLVVHPALPVKSVKDFIALAKSRPKQLTYASNGEGGNLHVQMALFASIANIQLIHVPYKGGAEMATSVISGETQSAVSTVGAALTHIQSGRMRALGVTSARRSAILPNYPTVAESGLPGYDINAWIGAFAPAGTPKTVVDRLQTEISKVLKRPDVAKQMMDQGVEPWPGTQQEFVTRIKSDMDQLQKVFRIIGTPAN